MAVSHRIPCPGVGILLLPLRAFRHRRPVAREETVAALSDRRIFNISAVTDRRYNDRLAMNPLKVGKATIGGKRPVFILGPCVIESEKFVWRMAEQIVKICAKEKVDLIFKAS